MTTYSAKGTALVGYNVQTAVDTKHHLIVAHQVTNNRSDRAQLSLMALAARDAMGKRELQATADRGDYSGPGLKACEDAGVAAIVPKPMTSNARAEGRFDKTDFVYIADADEYQCPAGQRAIHRFSRKEAGLEIHIYWSSACPSCPMRAQCTTSNYRRIRRWEHEDVMDAAQERLDRMPDAMTVRKRTVEHVFGTLKHWMGGRRSCDQSKLSGPQPRSSPDEFSHSLQRLQTAAARHVSDSSRPFRVACARARPPQHAD